MTEPTALAELKTRLQEISDLQSAAAVLGWDQQTHMPPGGAASRGQQLATLARLAHQRFTDKRTGALLDSLASYAEQLPSDHDNACLIRVTQRDYDKATRIPSEFLNTLYRHGAESYQLWTEARPANGFGRVRPMLEKTLELSREYADFYPGYAHPADPLIDESNEGMTVDTLRPLFAELKSALVPMVETISAQPPSDDSCLKQRYPEREQLALGIELISRFGYDFTRGRQDKTHHPFATRFSSGDVRITTRFKENDLSEGLFSTLHESGHGMYEQGVAARFDGTPLARGASSGVHESQSRLWENIVGRSLGFWTYAYPELQQRFPSQLSEVPLDTFYRAINKVAPSLIRTDADEVTYNLHVIIRFELELELLEGNLAVQDLPESWRARYQEALGVRPDDDRDGVLQDVHWFAGTIGGAFQGYTLGNILSAQIYRAALNAHPEIPNEIAVGEFASLHGWLKDNLYQHGRKFTPHELIRRVTGKPLSLTPYLEYLQGKYGALYPL